jgi:hypothetical protein
MRAAVIAIWAAACTPEISSGSYLCGPEQLCPEGQRCNGPDNVCVLASQAQPFACGGADDPIGDDGPAGGPLIADLTCVSTLREMKGCLREMDPADFFQLDVPAGCAAVQVEATVSFPIAFAPLRFRFASGTELADVETPCAASQMPVPGDDQRCFRMAVQPGAHHAIGLVRDGTDDCAGGCSYNRYTLRFRLSTP